MEYLNKKVSNSAYCVSTEIYHQLRENHTADNNNNSSIFLAFLNKNPMTAYGDSDGINFEKEDDALVLEVSTESPI